MTFPEASGMPPIAARQIDSAAVSLSDGTERTVVEANGSYSACDVWFLVPNEWPINVALRLYAKLGGMRTLLRLIYLADAAATPVEGLSSGIALSVRGRPCDGFELTAQRTSGGALTNGKFSLQVWSASEPTGVVGGAPLGITPITPVRGEASVAVMAAEVTDSGPIEERLRYVRVTSGGQLMARVEGNGASGTPSGGVLSVQGPGAGGLLTVQGAGAGGILTVQGPGTAGAFSLEGIVEVGGKGSAGDPSGGVLTVQGPGTTGQLTVTGDQSGGAHMVVGAGTGGAPSGGVVTVQGHGASGALTVPQGAAAAASGRWPVYLSDAAAAQGVVGNPLFVRLSDGSAAFGSATNPLHARAIHDTAAYAAASAVVTGPTTAASVKSLAYLWRAASKRVEIQRIVIAFADNADTSGRLSFRGARITAENGTPGGTSLTPDLLDKGDLAATATFRYGANAPTRATVDTFVGFQNGAQGNFIWDATTYGKPIVLRGGQSEGFEIRAVAEKAFTTGMFLFVSMLWNEI